MRLESSIPPTIISFDVLKIASERLKVGTGSYGSYAHLFSFMSYTSQLVTAAIFPFNPPAI